MQTPAFAVSTSWKIDKHSNIRDGLTAIKKTGVNAIEVGCYFNEDRLEELIATCIDLEIVIPVVHNFCPLPLQIPWGRSITDIYRLSASDQEERRIAVDYTKKTIDTANSIGAGIVIIDTGVVEMDNKYVKSLIRLFEERKRNTPEYELWLETTKAERKTLKDIYLDNLVKSLGEIMNHALECNVKIAIQNRMYLFEIPTLDEIEYLIDLFGNRGLVYWHDTANAAIQEKMGIGEQIDYLTRLKTFKDCMRGCYLHDIKGLTDHLLPFSGEINFKHIMPYLKGNIIKVLTPSKTVYPQQIKDALAKLTPLLQSN